MHKINKDIIVDVSFVIIEYNCINNILQCIDAIRANCIDINFEIIVSSNSCYKSEKQEELINRYKNIIWVFNKTNIGFAAGMNEGIKRSSSDAVVIQAPDSKINNKKLLSALDILERNPSIGLIGPKMINANNKEQDSCRNFLTPYRFLARMINRFFIHKDMKLSACINKTNTYVDWVIGAFMIIPRRTITDVGLLNDNYFLYVEDMEYCLRIWEKGMKVFYYPELEIIFEGDRKSATKLKYSLIHTKNYLLFLINNWFILDSCSNKRIKSLDYITKIGVKKPKKLKSEQKRESIREIEAVR